MLDLLRNLDIFQNMFLLHKPAQVSVLSLAFASFISSISAFELGSCALLQIDSEESEKSETLVILVEAEALLKETDRTISSSATDGLDSFLAPAQESSSMSSSFSTDNFITPVGTQANEESSIFDLGANDSPFGGL